MKINQIQHDIIPSAGARLNGGGTFTNPFIWSDIPDLSVIRVGDVYYMTSTTMYFSPGCPVMKSYDLVNWEIVNYVYDILDDSDSFTLSNGKNAYGQGSWASSLRYHNGTFYVAFAANNTGKTYIFQTEDIENGPWRKYVIDGIYHDMSILFDDDGRVYMVYGGGTIRVIELTSGANAIKPGGLNKVIIQNAHITGEGIVAEGSHIYKRNGKYYIFIICWPRTGTSRRIQTCYVADSIGGFYEGRVVLDDNLGFQNAGVAQGGIVDTPNGGWYALLFQDHGAVGRIPVLVPVKWENDFPVFGVEGKVPEQIKLPAAGFEAKSVVKSDEFNNPGLMLEWQWNHNPENSNWSLTDRPGWLRLTTGRVNQSIIDARNTLTQRTFGPECSGTAALDVSNMKNGDVAGLAALQEYYGFVGVKMENGEKYIISVNANGGRVQETDSIPLTQDMIYLRVDFDFKDTTDRAYFYYSLDNINWVAIGGRLNMSYRLTHFTGYRFALFNYATQTTGGYVDFDWFRISDKIN